MNLSINLIYLAVATLMLLVVLYLCRKNKKPFPVETIYPKPIAQEVEVESNPDASWITFDTAIAYKKELTDLGFTSVDVYSTDLGIDLWVFLNTDHTQAAVVTNIVGEQSLEFSAIEKGSKRTIDVTDKEATSETALESDNISISKPHREPTDLYAVFLKSIQGKDLEKMPPESIPSLIQDLFAQEMSKLTDSDS